MLSEEKIRNMLKDRRMYLEAHVLTHFYDVAHDDQVVIYLLKVILEEEEKE